MGFYFIYFTKLKQSRFWCYPPYSLPPRIKMHPTHFWIKLSALVNVLAGTAYIWWRAARSMPDNAKR